MNLKEIHKNPLFYYILAPAVIAIWPLLVMTAYMPRVQKQWQIEKALYEDKAVPVMKELYNIDPERLNYADPNFAKEEFDYPSAVHKVATSLGIPAANYTTNSRPPRVSNGQKSQTANVVLKEVDIKKFADFLSTIQFRWPNLQCENLKLTKNKGLPDSWKVDLDFRYYY